MSTLTVSLPPRLDEFVSATLESGRYSSASEVIGEGLRLLAARDEVEAARVEAFKAEVAAGLADIEAGRYESFDSTEEMLARLATLRTEAFGNADS